MWWINTHLRTRPPLALVVMWPLLAPPPWTLDRHYWTLLPSVLEESRSGVLQVKRLQRGQKQGLDSRTGPRTFVLDPSQIRPGSSDVKLDGAGFPGPSPPPWNQERRFSPVFFSGDLVGSAPLIPVQQPRINMEIYFKTRNQSSALFLNKIFFYFIKHKFENCL